MPRLWLAVQPEDERLQPGQKPEGQSLWSLLCFNSGPALSDVELEFELGQGDGKELRQFEFSALEENSFAYLFLGGPSAEPPKGPYRVRAKGLDGAPVLCEAYFEGFERPPDLPEGVEEMASIPLLPAAAWSPEEYAQILSLEVADGPPDAAWTAGLSFTQQVARLMRSLSDEPSQAAARELAWAAARAVFGACDDDLRDEVVQARLDAIAGDVQELIQARVELKRPLGKVPQDELSLAVSQGDSPGLYLINPGQEAVQDVVVHVERMRWGDSPEILEPMEFRFGEIRPDQATLVRRLEPDDRSCSLDCTVEIGENAPFEHLIFHGFYPQEQLTEEATAIPVPYLDHRLAQVRRMEVTDFMMLEDGEDSGKRAA